MTNASASADVSPERSHREIAMLERRRIRWFWAAAGLASVSALLAFLSHTADAPPASGEVVVLPQAAASPSPPAMRLAAPELRRVVLDGPRSSALFRLADGTDRSIGLDEVVQPGWTLVAVDGASATLATPDGRRRILLDAVPPAPSEPETRAVAIPEAVARAADGEVVSRCTDPEC